MKQLISFLFILLFFTSINTTAQVGIGTVSPHASAQLDVTSTTKGLLPPRMTTAERNLISSPATGLVIFNTTTNGLEIKTSLDWISATADAMPTIQIGTQKWMNKNLEVAFYRNGDSIPEVTDANAWAALTTGAWCYYNNDPANGAIYGKLYNWYAVTDPRGLAPAGWHIPTDAEWTTLTTTLGGENVAGCKMKTPGTANWTTPNTGATNRSGFTGLPGGFCTSSGEFLSVGNVGFWWSATEHNNTHAWYRSLFSNDINIVRNIGNKEIGWSVRCVRD